VRCRAIVRQTDAERERAYDRQLSIGKLDKALNEVQAKGWTVVDMKNDWNRVFHSRSPEMKKRDKEMNSRTNSPGYPLTDWRLCAMRRIVLFEPSMTDGLELSVL